MHTMLVGQRSLATQRRGRHVSGSSAHPDRMAPDLAVALIYDYTQPGDLAVDPFAGVGTTLAEAVRGGRDAYGVEYDPGWVALARANLALARRQSGIGHGQIVRGDVTRLPAAPRRELRGRASLVLTAPPSSATMPVSPRSSARHNRVDLMDGITAALEECVPLLNPNGLIVVVSRSSRRTPVLLDAVAADLSLLAVRHAAYATMRAGRLVAGRHHVDGIRYDDILVLRPRRGRRP
ncbi:TRM11 family SAM-dependent methyltransferase [Actinoplanes aureus]|uniref:Methyltransferase n=1 Tax=Actinoplanes aureus TaxID=2792083 RepID=A0A931CCF7_9ACTN|nr:DNA methyltransferase [Actinoplanes aureus]MBG0567350.1 hypothetical protein [Actinoplanes aureus]